MCYAMANPCGDCEPWIKQCGQSILTRFDCAAAAVNKLAMRVLSWRPFAGAVRNLCWRATVIFMTGKPDNNLSCLQAGLCGIIPSTAGHLGIILHVSHEAWDTFNSTASPCISLAHSSFWHPATLIAYRERLLAIEFTELHDWKKLAYS